MFDAFEGFNSQDKMGGASNATAAAPATTSSTVGDLTAGDAESASSASFGGFQFGRGDSTQAALKTGINPTVLIIAGVGVAIIAAYVLLKMKGKV